MNVCVTCGIPWDAGFFDESRVFDLGASPLGPGQQLILARYELHRNYCGVLMGFAQFTDLLGTSPANVRTPGYEWRIQCNGQPREPYLTFDHIINPWGYGGFPVQLRLEEGCTVEIAIRNVDVPPGDARELSVIGGRITGRYWYNADFGGAPNRL